MQIKHEVSLSLTHTQYTHLHAGNFRGGEKQAYLLREGKEWRKEVKKEKEKRKDQELYYQAKRKVETGSKE